MPLTLSQCLSERRLCANKHLRNLFQIYRHFSECVNNEIPVLSSHLYHSCEIINGQQKHTEGKKESVNSFNLVSCVELKWDGLPRSQSVIKQKIWRLKLLSIQIVISHFILHIIRTLDAKKNFRSIRVILILFDSKRWFLDSNRKLNVIF